jgi:GNAT superfamily N-acetyltransferase
MRMLTIRQYRHGDAEEVGKLIADTFVEFNLSHLPPEQIDLFLGPFRYARSPEKTHQAAIAQVITVAPMVLVAEQDGEIVGVLRAGTKEQEPPARPYLLRGMFVKGSRQRQGIGRRLVEQFEEDCLRQGEKEVRLAATLNAIPFFRKMGYQPTGEVEAERNFEGEGLKVQPMEKVFKFT